MVYYRKYRPQSLDELIGQDHVKTTLTHAFEADKLSHAYLFCGPKGSGKTSTARILAKLVNCESLIVNRKSEEAENDTRSTINDRPCNKCSACLSITDGSSLDLIEIDAASNRGIDDIRELREKIKLAPSSSRKKVYIIDEVHMLTTEAFNALLKTLEEPPEHVLFILATTEIHKIPQTILSRVVRLNFHQAKVDDLVAALKNVAKGEKIKVSDEVLKLIAQKADGSFRDALKLLDQLASSNEEITLEVVQTQLKSGQFEDIHNLLLKINEEDSAAALNLVNEQLEKGINFKEFILSLMETLRSMLLIQNGVTQAIKEDLGSVNYPQVLSLSKQFSMEQVIKILGLLQEALQFLKFSPIPSLPLEVAVVESCLQEKVESIKYHVSREDQKHQAFLVSETHQRLSSRHSEKQSDVESLTMDPGSSMSGMTKEKEKTPVKASDDISSEEIVLIRDKWQFILETIKPYNYSLEALLRQANILSAEQGLVTLEVPYSFHQRILQAPKSRNLLESVLSDVLGKAARVTTVIGKRPVRIEELANVEVAADDEIIRVAAEIFNS